MKYHIPYSYQSDLEEKARHAKAGKCPSDLMWQLSQILTAKIHQLEPSPISPIDKLIDKILAKIFASPSDWSLARQLSSQVQSEDVVFCYCEQLGIPIAVMCSWLQPKPKIVVFTHKIQRLRGYVALKLFNIADKVDVFVTYTNTETEFLRRYLNLPEHRVRQIYTQPPIDTSFFSPGKPSYQKTRPLIVSGGFQKRDYLTLAQATQDLNIDVKICASYRQTNNSNSSFPEYVPSNMLFDYCKIDALAQLYRDADIVVMSMLDNNYEAGLTTLFEAMACRKPVIMTRSSQPGIINELIDAGVITGVSPGNPVELQQAITKILDDPQGVQTAIDQGYEIILKRFNHVSYLQDITSILQSLQADDNQYGSQTLVEVSSLQESKV